MNSLRPIFADLHLHTVASACAEVEMIPPLIVRRARELGIELLAVTDHHSVENAAAVQEAARAVGIEVLAGMEVQTREEVHVVCYFDDTVQAEQWQEMIWKRLPGMANRPEFFGEQYVVDATGAYVRTNERLLQTSTDLSFDELFWLAEQWGVLAVPAHVDRPRYSLFANLGVLPEAVRLPGVEISRNIAPQEALRRFPSLRGLGMVQSGDAHRLKEMTNSTLLKLKEPTAQEVRKALLGQEGRSVKILEER
jgi:PHP family Zn ribbon phosphoesterase